MNINEKTLTKNDFKKIIPALKVENFSKKYQGRKNFAVENASFVVYPGEFHGFIGANGAGKTTTIKSLIGAYARYQGKISIYGHPNISKKGKKYLGYIPETSNFPKALSAWEYIALMAEISGIEYNKAKSYARKILIEMGLKEVMNKKPNSFSSGQKKKVLLAQALINNPDLIIMDEPAANLDPQARLDFFNTLQKLQKEGKAIFISSHILAELDNFVTAITILDEGKIIYTGKKAKLLTSDPFTYHVTFNNLKHEEIFQTWMKKQKIKYKNLLGTEKGHICQFNSIQTKQKALTFINQEQLDLINFRLHQKTLQQAYYQFAIKSKNKKQVKEEK